MERRQSLFVNKLHRQVCHAEGVGGTNGSSAGLLARAALKEAAQLVHSEAGSIAQVFFFLEGVYRRCDHQGSRRAYEG